MSIIKPILRKIPQPSVFPVIGVPFRMGGGQSWSTYWATRTPSTLALTRLSSTSIRLNWLNGGTGYDGTSIERSTDGVTYAEVVTVASGVLQYDNTGLSAGTTYYYRVRCYKGTNYSPYSNVSSASTFEAELGVYMAGLVTPLSNGQLILLDNFIKGIKTGLSITNLSDAFDVLWILAGETQESSLKNIVKNLHHCTNVNASDFVALEGFTGNGASNYLDTNYNPSGQGVNLVQNSASLFMYSRTNTGTGFDIGGDDATRHLYLSAKAGTSAGARINDTNGLSVANADASGFYIVNRTAANARVLYRNLLSIKDDTWASNGRPNHNLYILCNNSNGTPSAFTTRQIAFAGAGRSLSSGERTIVQNAIETYMDANGKGVIT